MEFVAVIRGAYKDALQAEDRVFDQRLVEHESACLSARLERAQLNGGPKGNHLVAITGIIRLCKNRVGFRG
jgi:hypothetical protein